MRVNGLKRDLSLWVKKEREVGREIEREGVRDLERDMERGWRLWV